ncbi:phosphohydrolase [Thermosipho melanesiensis]|uniref:Metal dependent phosphohydrolase n=2 Tax=Thermosipho melanesiensis TaxID=46541 RepID=A6LN41_THEM4|nr:HDOD domain-containing protein [Thermosipho melanesiensis]ABR31342.1 metal dependent phosphohydrolase [Thermosipho melanesiensis BI429]APT74402.1 phosphohydrolase [Thermosipho melanesiensis]OOC36365.1 phosphohydrolase [Thermosipho melanesiensis]OOC37183.1 phosphohydrolase [Thermosipho melanesiensis]OOC37935.1 phosphohydrolase [Thermosipho melanesiensis]
MLIEYVKEIEEIPTPDFQVRRIIDIASNPDSSIKDLEKAISIDASLSLKVLKLVNSAYYGLPRKITKISEAVMILGFKTVRNLALSIFTYSSLNKGSSNINKKKLWKHFMSTAIISETVSKIIGYPEQEEAFMAGLLHDVGKIVLDIAFPRYINKIVEKSMKENICFYEIEKSLGVETHNHLGAFLIEEWKLPELFQVVSMYHDEPEANENDAFNIILYIVHLSNYFSNLLYKGYSCSYCEPLLSLKSFEILGIKPSNLTDIFIKIKDALSRAKDLLEGGEDNES